MKFKSYWLPTNSAGFRSLSQSSMHMFLKCQRAFYLKHIEKAPEDEGETGPLERGALFHELVEGKQETTILDDKIEEIKVRAMVQKYKHCQQEGTIFVPTHKEQFIVNEKHQFIGYIDDLFIDEDEGICYIGENKTTSYKNTTLYKILNSFQVALYFTMINPFLRQFWMSQKDVKWIEVREMVMPLIKPLKGRGKNATPETDELFFARCLDSSEINILRGLPSEETCHRALATFSAVKEAIDEKRENKEKYYCNHEMCFGFWGRKTCPFLTYCHPQLKDVLIMNDDSNKEENDVN